MALVVQDLTLTLKYPYFDPHVQPRCRQTGQRPLPLLLELNVREIDDAQYIAAILRSTTPNTEALEDIHEATASDSELQVVLASLQKKTLETNQQLNAFLLCSS